MALGETQEEREVLTQAFMSARALSECPISRMQWWILPGPSLPWAISKPRPGPRTMFSLGTRTCSNRTSPWPPERPKQFLLSKPPTCFPWLCLFLASVQDTCWQYSRLLLSLLTRTWLQGRAGRSLSKMENKSPITISNE